MLQAFPGGPTTRCHPVERRMVKCRSRVLTKPRRSSRLAHHVLGIDLEDAEGAERPTETQDHIGIRTTVSDQFRCGLRTIVKTVSDAKSTATWIILETWNPLTRKVRQNPRAQHQGHSLEHSVLRGRASSSNRKCGFGDRERRPLATLLLDYPQPVSTADLANDCAVIQVAIPMLDHVSK